MTGDRVYLRHVLDAIKKIESYASVGRTGFMSTSHWQGAIIRQLEIMGEGTKRLSNNLRPRHTEVPWRRIAGLRDVLIHYYFGVDLAAGWKITQKDLPTLKGSVEGILPETGNDET